MLRRACAGFVHHGGEPGAAALRDDHAVRAHALGRADDRAEIVRIGDLVAHDEKRRFAAVGGELQQILHRAVFLHGAERHDALVRVGLAHCVELAAVGLHDDDALRARLRGNVAQRLVDLALGNVDLVDRASGAQRLDDGVAALDVLVDVRFKFHMCWFPSSILRYLYRFNNNTAFRNKKAQIQKILKKIALDARFLPAAAAFRQKKIDFQKKRRYNILLVYCT